MAKNWSKIVLVSMLVLVVFASLAVASTSRTRSLAKTGDFISDDSNVFRWYSTLSSYGNMVQAEVGTYSGFGTLMDTRGLSLNYTCGEDGEWGTYRLTLNENAVDHPGFYINNPFFASQTPGTGAPNLFGPGAEGQTPVNKWDVAGGWELGEEFAIGVSFTRSSWDWESDFAPDSTLSNSFTTIGFGGTYTNNDNMVLDVALSLGFAGGEVEIATDPVTTTEYDSKNAFNGAARLFYDWKDYVTIVPLVEVATHEYSVTQQPDPGLAPPNGDKVTAFRGGIGLDIEVNNSNMLVLALEFAQNKWEFANADTASATVAERKVRALPTIRMALETAINSWMTTRIGAVKHNTKTTITTNGGEEVSFTNGSPPTMDSFNFVSTVPYGAAQLSSSAGSGFEWFLGVGFNVAEWTIDMELAHETPFSLGWWLHGYTAFEPEDEGPVGRISASYNF